MSKSNNHVHNLTLADLPIYTIHLTKKVLPEQVIL